MNEEKIMNTTEVKDDNLDYLMGIEDDEYVSDDWFEEEEEDNGFKNGFGAGMAVAALLTVAGVAVVKFVKKKINQKRADAARQAQKDMNNEVIDVEEEDLFGVTDDKEVEAVDDDAEDF